jgi:hypothetical protein
MNYRLTRRSFAVDGKMKEVIVKVIVGGFARLEIGPVISVSSNRQCDENGTDSNFSPILES